MHSGVRVDMTLLRASTDTGVVFRRTDVGGGQGEIAATYDNVGDTHMCTRVRNPDGIEVSTIEHLMAAFAGVGVDNVIVELDGPEVPVMDGSAAPFVFLIECAGVEEQNVPRGAIQILKHVEVCDGERQVSLSPADDFSLNVEIDFGHPLIGHQKYFVALDDGVFKNDVSPARTFGFMRDVEALKALGLARGGSLDNAVVIDGDRIINDEGLRFGDEFVRHKALDSIGDMYLAGAPLLAHYRGVCAGHTLNQRLLRAVFADPDSWRFVNADDFVSAVPSSWPERKVAALA